MKRTLVAAIGALLAAAAMPAQQGSAQRTQPAGLGKAETASNEEMNIRAYIELLRTDLKQGKTEVMGAVMQLSADQATKFWPVYKEFEAEYATLGDQIVAVVRTYADNYTNLTDAVADQLANKVLDIEQQRNALKKKYYERMKEALGAITATRFLQVENQLERVLDLQVAAQLPVVGER